MALIHPVSVPNDKSHQLVPHNFQFSYKPVVISCKIGSIESSSPCILPVSFGCRKDAATRSKDALPWSPKGGVTNIAASHLKARRRLIHKLSHRVKNHPCWVVGSVERVGQRELRPRSTWRPRLPKNSKLISIFAILIIGWYIFTILCGWDSRIIRSSCSP
jgi:hypothetical protein